MKVIHSNDRSTVGIISGVDSLVNLGLFERGDIDEWINTVKDVFGDDEKVFIQFKESENTEQQGFMICASTDGGDPKVAVCGRYPADGKGWGE